MKSRAIAAMLLSTAAIGCSPYEYEKEIGRFEDGVTALAESFNEGAAGHRADRARLLRWYVISKPESVLQTTRACNPSLIITRPSETEDKPSEVERADCALVLKNDQGDDPPYPVSLEKELQEAARISAVMAVLKSYATALQEITDSEDSAQLAAAQGRFADGLGPLTAAAQLPGAGVQAAVKLFNTGLKLTLEQRRYHTLQITVVEMDDTIQEATKVLTGAHDPESNDSITNLYHSRQKAAQAAAIKRMQAALEKAKAPELATLHAARLDALMEAVARYERLRSTDPNQAAASMATAHSTLRTALEEGAGQAGAVFKNVETFAKQAIALRDALSI